MIMKDLWNSKDEIPPIETELLVSFKDKENNMHGKWLYYNIKTDEFYSKKDNFKMKRNECFEWSVYKDVENFFEGEK